MKNTSITTQFFLETLQAIALKTSIPPIPEGLELSLLQTYINKHHVRLLFSNFVKRGLLNLAQQNFWVQRYLLLCKELTQLHHEFEIAKIPFVILKGIPLNIQLYGANCLRETRDIDCLIAEKDLLAAHQSMLNMGYNEWNTNKITLEKIVHRYPFLCKHLYQIAYWHPTKKVMIQIKWRTSMMNSRFLDWTEKSNFNIVNVQGTPIMTLNAEHNFFYLCHHAAKHSWDHLKWLMDLAIISNKRSFDWEKVFHLAEQLHAERSVLEASMLLHKYFNISSITIPHTWRDKMIVYLRIKRIQKWWFQTEREKLKFDLYKLVLFELFLYPRLRQKCQYLIARLASRIDALQQLAKLKKPSTFKIIFCGIWHSFASMTMKRIFKNKYA